MVLKTAFSGIITIDSRCRDYYGSIIISDIKIPIVYASPI